MMDYVSVSVVGTLGAGAAVWGYVLTRKSQSWGASLEDFDRTRERETEMKRGFVEQDRPGDVDQFLQQLADFYDERRADVLKSRRMWRPERRHNARVYESLMLH